MEYGKTLTNEIDQASLDLDAVLQERYAKAAKGFDEHSVITKQDVAAFAQVIGNLGSLGAAGAFRGVTASGKTASWLKRFIEVHIALSSIRNEISRAEMINGALVAKQKDVLRWARNKTQELRGSM